MAVFVSDTFTDTAETNLVDHTGETGATWTKVTGITGNAFISDANRVKGDGGTDAYYASGSPASAEYDVEATLFVKSNATTETGGLLGRVSTSAHTCYRVDHVASLGQWRLFKVEAGSFTSLGTFSQTLSDETGYAVKLEIRDAAKKVFIDGVERISSANNDITAAGKAGVIFDNIGTNSTGYHLDTFTATDAGVEEESPVTYAVKPDSSAPYTVWGLKP